MSKVSILIPSQGVRDEILQTLESCYRQTRQPDRIMVDFGQDWKKMNGMAKACGTDALILLGDDDILDSEYVEKTMEWFDKGYDIVYTGMKTFGQHSCYFPPAPWTLENMRKDKKPQFTSLCSTKMFLDLGGFDFSVGKCLDWDFWWRALKAGYKAYPIDEPLFNYRIHPGQDSQSGGMAESRQKVIEKNA